MSGVVPSGKRVFKNWYDIMAMGKEVLNVKASVDDAIAVACDYHGFTRAEMFARDRRRVVVEARNMLAHYLYHDVGMTYSAIGRIAMMDHTTILNSVRKHEIWMEVDRKYAAKYVGYIQALNKRCAC